MSRFCSLVPAVALATSLQMAVAASSAEPGEWKSAQERASSTSIVWLESSNENLGERAKLLTEFLKKSDLTADLIFNFGKSIGLLVEGNATATRPKLQEIFNAFVGDDKVKIFGNADSPVRPTVESNTVLHSFADCTESKLRYNEDDRLDWGVEYVWQKKPPDDYTGAHVAWVIDSGIGTGFPGELNVVKRKDCTQGDCRSDGQKTDRVGHATMIAGVIGARKGNSKGVIGVAPGAFLYSLRVVDDSTGQLNISSVVTALNWILGNATANDDGDNTTPSPGDVVNLSLGAAWSAASKSQKEVETALRVLADKGLKISIAAGNSDALGGLAYVQAITPARIGGYGPTASGGLIATVSAFDKRGWFWEFSAFGNYYDYYNNKNEHKERASLPDFSEPGVDILSLWPGPDLAICSGTSLSAAHLSGILLWGDVYASGKAAQFDRSAGKVDLGRVPKPGNPGDYVEGLLDPIGVKTP